ncbi:MAG: hypothetical protein ACP5IK_03620 [Candidatus Micrarchaeia archaeon]
MPENSKPNIEMLQSTFIPFKQAQEQKAELEREYYFYLTNLELAPQKLVDIGISLIAKASLFDFDEKETLESIINRLQIAVNEYIIAEDEELENEALSKIRSYAYEFIKTFEQYDLQHGGSYSVKAQKASTVWDVLAKAISVDGYSTSNVGMPIHYTQRILAEFAFQRLQKNMDFIALVVGRRGVGKSTWALEFASAFKERLGQELSLDDIILTEKRESLFEAIKTWQPYSCHIFDEAINQLFNRDFFKGSDFISLLTEIRYKRTVNLFIIPELYQIDKIMRDGLSDLLVYVTERGKAVLMLPQLIGTDRFNLNIDTDEAVIVPEELTDMLLSTKQNAIAVSYFTRIPESNPFFTTYQSIKDKKISTRELVKPSKERKEDILHKIIVDIAVNHPNKEFLTTIDMREYSEKYSYYVSDKDALNFIAKTLGLKKEMLYTVDADGTMRIDLTHSLIRSWLQKIAKQARGEV